MVEIRHLKKIIIIRNRQIIKFNNNINSNNNNNRIFKVFRIMLLKLMLIIIRMRVWKVLNKEVNNL
jgi:hypothetical protein